LISLKQALAPVARLLLDQRTIHLDHQGGFFLHLGRSRRRDSDQDQHAHQQERHVQDDSPRQIDRAKEKAKEPAHCAGRRGLFHGTYRVVGIGQNFGAPSRNRKRRATSWLFGAPKRRAATASRPSDFFGLCVCTPNVTLIAVKISVFYCYT
jgi:hypothetical protein